LTKLFVKKGETLGVGKPLFGVDVDAAKPAGSAPKEAPVEKKELPKQA
jgi:pyruvate/2-oxoglutarate dehydrogenase complex dihydrolipoamide acyltransferase (E2) component